MQSPGHRSLPALACSAAFVLCELISRPWAGMGISDDWSYIRSAQILAQTGHIHYVGWAAASVGWQLTLGAALIKLFGFSFTAPRLGTLLIALITTYLTQRTLVRFGLSESNAVLGTLTFVLSPLYLPLSATMMTDVPAFFSVLGCIYGCIRALQSTRDRDSILWLSFAVAINAICGTSRQNVWVGVVALVPSVLWLMRRRRAVLLSGLLLTALGFAFIVAAQFWFNRQPYALGEPISLPPLQLWAWKRTALQCARAIFEISLLIFPVVIAFIAAARRFYPRAFATLAALSAAAIAACFYLEHRGALHIHVSPFNQDWVGPHALFESTGLASAPPAILSPAAYTALSILALVGLLSIAATTLLGRPVPRNPRPTDKLTWPQLAIFFGPFVFLYTLILVKRGSIVIFDRYLFALIFIAILCLLLYTEQRLDIRSHAAAFLSLAALAFYGILITHNTFALARARVVLANEVLATGIPASSIDLGWESNGWYELQLSDHINQPNIVSPADAYHPYPQLDRAGCHEQTPFGFYPHLAPRFGIAYEPSLCAGPTAFAPVTYSTWPLFHPTTLYVIQYQAPWRSALETTP